MIFFTKLFLLLCIAYIGFTSAMNKENYDLLYKDEYIIGNYYGCIPKLIIKNSVDLYDKKNNIVRAEARYYLTYLSSTAELKKAHAWLNNKDIRDIFLVHIIEHIQLHYPHIKRLECPYQKIAWDFK